MKIVFHAAVLGCLTWGLPSCHTPTPLESTQKIWLGNDTHVRSLAPGVWLHVSSRELPEWGPVPSNGLIVSTTEGAVLVDTAWSNEQTELLFDWAREELDGVRAIVITHFHEDRLGGLAAARKAGIPSYASAKTIELAAADGWPAIDHSLSTQTSLEQLGIAGEFFFPGPAHSADNAVVYLEESAVLFGGCPVRSASAQSMGNLADASLATWPEAISRLLQRYPDVRIVVPGHGEPGDKQLLTHTLELLAN
ncbi:MAG: subclass B1 metallo-beta-lactamase [Planctomycetota bacterium]|jgi:metallo-beta-lactamase class B